eukprot:CAMPEP_0170483396 /NCGR_PEP_ID=MMETSP0208-20121228/3080_1 /TAXON_ID=197538 /ORGANISM="Strombidium inclinatum, Strain S3" /LENGTH=56 /DNA_ID=CAMNT_0010756413 /DNA_START=1459 /DNA_END=1629 /DNA_ORIENTATION=-
MTTKNSAYDIETRRSKQDTPETLIEQLSKKGDTGQTTNSKMFKIKRLVNRNSDLIE